ncbi:MAG: DNA polymerase III subunit gamma/tau [Sedimentisphaerales bacterium]|nr:DNA polymerase III subunit gamma/tau [Sedimentisphaerales bacterium]
MYKVLALKYRSQSFDDVVGQDPIAQTLKNAIKTDRVAHAYLFTGTRGVGKTTMARILAKALNCLSADKPTIEPCCKCESCIAVNLGEDIDVLEIDGASNNGVEEVRKLRENAIYRPTRARFKIYIIDEVHMLTTSAFNALLKILEEPPSHVKFIFATTEPNKVLATIQSRCQRYDFSNIAPAVIAEQLKKVLKLEKIEFEDGLVIQIAKMANGSMRDALSLLDRLISVTGDKLTVELLEQFLGCPNYEQLSTLVSRIADNDDKATLDAANELINSGMSEIRIVDALTDFMRDLMVAKSAGLDSELLLLTSQQKEKIAELIEKFDIAGLVYCVTSLEKIRWQVKNTDNPRALLEALLLRFALAEHFLNVEQLLNNPASARAAVKKNVKVETTSTTAPKRPIQDLPPAKPKAPSDSSAGGLDDWPRLLSLITDELGNGTAGLLSAAKPVGFTDDVLTLSFDAKGRMSMDMCRSNGRLQQIQGCLSAHFGKPVKLKLILEGQRKTDDKPKQTESSYAKKRQEIVSDPAVKAVLTGLDATITNIEEDI